MARKQKKKRRMATVPVASMGDIAFLLIIFFLLLSEFDKDKNVPMQLPMSSKVKKVEYPLAARIDIDKDGNIHLDGKQVKDSRELESELINILKNAISDDQRHVQFKCDEEQIKDIFVPVFHAIAEAGGIPECVGEEKK